MFSKQQDPVLADLSNDLRDENDWHLGSLKTIDFLVNVAALAVEPVSGILAIGTADGFIHLFGGPGVQCKVSLPEPAAVRLLQFSSSTFSITCLDGNNQFHAFSLLEFGKPKLITSARFDQTNSMTLSPSHSHVFLGLQNGDVKTYDLTCKRKSPYTIPNLWKLYEEKMAASGMPSLTPPTPANVVDVLIHPRNLDLVFVAYTGGIILTDLTQRSSIRAYELILPPGAPGGNGYGGPDLLTHRRMQVSSMVMHPSGHFFVAGYEDGSIAFWAVEDDNKPLLVRTLDEVDVNLVHAEHLEQHMSSNAEQRGVLHIKEPIFKLSWSSYTDSTDPRGGDTTLAILGGLDERKHPGLSAFLLPAFNPSEPPSDQPVPQQKELHPHFRNAMCQSLTPTKTFFYETRGLVQDYLLLARKTPHLGGNFDPYAVLIVEEIEGERSVNAQQYPPPAFISADPSPSTVNDSSADDEVDGQGTPIEGLASPPISASSSKSARLLDEIPAHLRTPVSLSAGATGIFGGQLLRLEKDIHQHLVAEGSSNDHHVNLKGGQAYAETTNELKLLKYQPHRVLVTYNRDSSVHFFDISQQLLLPDPSAKSLLERDWPEALPALTILLDELFDDVVFSGMVMAQMDQVVIASVHFASEALECAIVLASGEVVVYHQLASRSDPPSVAPSKEIVPLGHIPPSPGRKMVPYFMLAPGKGPVETCAMSDVGFLAVSYKDGALFVVDMRGPKTIFSTGQAKKQRQSVFPLHPGDASADCITSLTWSISPLKSDRHLSVRLIAARQSGITHVYTIVHTANQASWSVSGDPAELKSVADPLPGGTFVLDKKTGAQWKADRSRFAATFKSGLSPVITATGGSASNECVLLVVGAKGAKTTANITGDKIGKADWGSRAGNVQSVQVVEHMGSRALVLQTDRHTALVYSLPHLEHICTTQIPTTSPLPLSIDDTGDFIAWTPYVNTRLKSQSTREVMQSATYGTFFDQRRAYLPPDIDFASTRGTVPAQPQPVSLGPASILGSWFTYNQTLTGAQVDELLGGPDRPVPQKAPVPAGSASGDVASSVGTATAGIAAGAAAAQTNIYNRLTSAMSERGQILGDLGERFNSLEEGSRNMVTQAKRLAAQQTAKSWFGF